MFDHEKRLEQKIDRLTVICEKILSLLEPGPPAGVNATITALNDQMKEITMPGKPLKTGADISVLDNGKVKIVLQAVDAAGYGPATLQAGQSLSVQSAIPSNTSAFTMALDPTDATGNTILGTPILPPSGQPLPTGITFALSMTLTNADGTTVVLYGSSAPGNPPVDVVAGGPAGVSAQLQAE